MWHQLFYFAYYCYTAGVNLGRSPVERQGRELVSRRSLIKMNLKFKKAEKKEKVNCERQLCGEHVRSRAEA